MSQLHRFRHSLTSVREVVWPVALGAAPYLLTFLAIGGIAWYVWFGGSSERFAGGSTGPEEIPVDRFVEAEALVEAGDLEAARSLMRELAPLDDFGGDARAHWWLAQDLLNPGRGEDGSEADAATKREALAKATEHLEHVVDRDEVRGKALTVLVQAYVSAGNTKAAFDLIDKKSSLLPGLNLMGADLASGMGDRRLAEKHAVAASAHFQRVCEDASLDDDARDVARPQWARAELALENFEEAREILRDWHPAESTDAERRKIFLLKRSWFGAIRESMLEGNVEESMSLLAAAADELVRSRELIEVAGALAMKGGESVKLELDQFYERMAGEAADELPMHVSLGSLALALNRTSDGFAHLERVLEIEPNHVVALNNLGYGLAFLAEPPNLDRARKLLDRALLAGKGKGRFPVNCWETRGQILAKQGRWAEAAIDLERALHSMPGQVGIHQTLAQAYRELGQGELASKHERMADELESPNERGPGDQLSDD